HRLACHPTATGYSGARYLDHAGVGVVVVVNEAGDQADVGNDADRLAVLKTPLLARRDHLRDEVRYNLVIAVDVIHQRAAIFLIDEISLVVSVLPNGLCSALYTSDIP